jgi:outer membrane lipoprotein-sorting protein
MQKGAAMMRRWHVAAMAVTAVVGLVAGLGASGQTVDELIASNLESKGGLARMRAIQTMKQTRRMNLQGMESPVVVYAKRPNMVRQEIAAGGRTVVMAYDGVTPWIVNPLAGAPDAVQVTGPMADSIRQDSDFDGPLVDYRDKGHTIELVGLETLGTAKVHHLKVTTKKGLVQHYYLDQKTALEVKIVMEMEPTTMEQEFSDYRAVEGIKIPFLVRTFANGVKQGELRLEKVEFNLKMEDAIFRMPKAK